MSVGKTLRDARMAKDLTIADVAAAIRLRATIIQDIEQDRFDTCGGEVYGRGHQRMYAKFLGLDIDSQITTSPNLETEFEALAIQPTMLKPIGAKPNWSVVLGVGSAVVIAMLAVILVGNNQGVSKPTPITAPSQTETENPTPENSESVTAPTNDGDLTAAVSDGVSIEIKVVSDSSWLRVEDSSGAVVFQGVLRVGDERTFTDSAQLAIVLGNAGGVNFTLNGVNLGQPGGLGQVLRLTVLPGQTSITS
jgi:cytoskeleton protein RodZ